MWKLKSAVILSALLVAMIWGATVAQGGWWWNGWWWNGWWWDGASSAEIGDLRTAWTVEDSLIGDSIDGDEFNYFTSIVLRLPQKSGFELLEQAAVENVKLMEVGWLRCEAGGIQGEVTYDVEPLDGAQGDKVVAWVTVNGLEVQRATGVLNEKLKLQFFAPAPEGVTPACYTGK